MGVSARIAGPDAADPPPCGIAYPLEAPAYPPGAPIEWDAGAAACGEPAGEEPGTAEDSGTCLVASSASKRFAGVGLAGPAAAAGCP